MPHALVKDPVRYKTIMCENWTRCGSCPYSYKCQFAHGPSELRQRPRESRNSNGAKAKENTPANTKTQGAEMGKGRFLRELLSRGATANEPNKPPTSAAIQALTPVCSPCSSREPSPRPSTAEATSTV